MIPFFRSLNELMVITQSRDEPNKIHEKNLLSKLSKESGRGKTSRDNNNRKVIELPILPSNNRRRWVKSKEFISKFFDELDYNNQIQSSYDLTLLENQKNYDQHDAA